MAAGRHGAARTKSDAHLEAVQLLDGAGRREPERPGAQAVRERYVHRRLVERDPEGSGATQ